MMERIKLHDSTHARQAPGAQFAGIHLLAELWGARVVADPGELRALLREAALAAGATVLGEACHAYTPQGITGVLLLAESHISLHTWPEHDYTAVDIFTCGRTTDPRAALAHLERALEPSRVQVQEVLRGLAAAKATGREPTP